MAVFEEWKAAIEGKAEGTHSHGSGGVVISIVANETALGTGSTDGEVKITADTGSMWTWSETNEEWSEQRGGGMGKALITAKGTADVFTSPAKFKLQAGIAFECIFETANTTTTPTFDTITMTKGDGTGTGSALAAGDIPANSRITLIPIDDDEDGEVEEVQVVALEGVSRISLSADQSLSAGVITTIALDTIDTDPLGVADVANNRMVIGKDGLYDIAGLSWGNPYSATGWANGYIYKNAAVFANSEAQAQAYLASSSTNNDLQFGLIARNVSLAAGDEIYLKIKLPVARSALAGCFLEVRKK